MDIQLHDLLRKTGNEVIDQTSANIISHYGPKSNWSIKPIMFREFWEQYCDIASEFDGPVCITISEKPAGTSPIVLQCKLRFHKRDDVDYFDGDHVFYGESFLIAFVKQCQEAMDEIFTIEKSAVELIACVLCSENHWEEDNTINTQFRVHFPYCRVNNSMQSKLLRPKIIEKLRSNNVLKYLVEQPIEDWDKIIDPNIPYAYLPMYRATINNLEKKMRLDYIWGKLNDEDLRQGTATNHELEQLIDSLSKHSYIHQGYFNASMFNKDVDFEYWIPLLLSNNFWLAITTEKPEFSSNSSTIFTFQSPAGFTSPNTAEIGDETDLEIAERLLPLLKPIRIEQDNYWLDVGKALYNSDNGGENGLKTWIQFSERSETRNAKMCRDKYYGFGETSIDIETIAFYAREDSPKEYTSWHIQWCTKAFDQATTCLHHDVAKALKRYYWLDYVCANVNNSVWYRFRGHRYVRLDSGIELSRALSSDFLHQFEILRSNITKRISELSDGNKEKDLLETQTKKITNLIGKLKTVSYKACIMKEARELFFKEKFMSYLDSNENLIGMLNCVIETYENHAYVRNGKPQDYVSMCTGINYRLDYNWDTPEVQNVMTWMKQTFCDHELKEYMLKDFSSFLKGRNSEKVFRIWTGGGNNSKSMVIKLFENAFGSYIIKMPTSLVVGQRTGASNATPELARSKGTHIAIIQEPDDDETLRKGIVKEFTGGDSFYARTLHDAGGDIQAMFNLILMCNKIPAIVNGDDATQNRIRICPYMSKWSRNAPEDEEEQYRTRHFMMDPFFEKKIPNMAQAFIWILVQYYPKYIREGLKIPEVVKIENEKYWKEHDCYMLYVEQCLVPVFKNEETGERDENAALTWAEIYNSYKMWFRENYPGVKIVNTQVAKDNFIKRLGPQKNRRWLGVKFREEETGFANI